MSDHKHVWGPLGCWCGAEQCALFGFVDVESGLFSHFGGTGFRLFFCQNIANPAHGEPARCDDHEGITR